MKHGGETVGRRPVFCLIALGDARGHETGKQGNRSADPGQVGLPNPRAIAPAVSTPRSAMSQPVPARPSPTAPPGRDHPNSLAGHRSPRTARSDLHPIPAIRPNEGSGIIGSGDRFRPGLIPTWATARQLTHRRQSRGELRQSLWQQGQDGALPVGSRVAPFADLGDGAAAAGAKPCARIERADIDTWRFRSFGHAFPLNAKRLPRYSSRAIGTAAISCRADFRPGGRTGLRPSSRDGPRAHRKRHEGGPLGPPSP